MSDFQKTFYPEGGQGIVRDMQMASDDFSNIRPVDSL